MKRNMQARLDFYVKNDIYMYNNMIIDINE